MQNFRRTDDFLISSPDVFIISFFVSSLSRIRIQKWLIGVASVLWMYYLHYAWQFEKSVNSLMDYI